MGYLPSVRLCKIGTCIFSQVQARPRADISGYSARAYSLMLLKKLTLSSLVVNGQNKLLIRRLRLDRGTLVGEYRTTEFFNPNKYEMDIFGRTLKSG